MIPVVVGILVALFINSLQESYRNRKLLESSMRSLSDVFKRNTENINFYLPRQARFLDTLQNYKADNTLSIFDIATKTKGIGSPDIYSTNWQASLNNNSIHLLNFQTVNLLSQIDAKYRELKDQEIFIYPMTYGPPMFKKGEVGMEYRRGLELWIAGYMGNEEELLLLYEKFDEIVLDNLYQRNVR